MKWINYILILIVCVGCIAKKTSNNELPTKPLNIIKNVNVFTGEKYLENTNVVFDGAKIVAITNDVAEFKNAKLIDGTGKTVIPPLANAHVHLFLPEQLKESIKEGIFVNLDMHINDKYANELRKYNDSLAYSSYYSSNAAATVPGGHGTQFGFAVPTINDSVSPAQFVQNRINAKADYIKVIKEPMMKTLTDEQSLAVIEEAHKNDVLAVGHSHQVAVSETLINQGIDGLMHVWFDKEAEDTFLKKMKEEDVFLVPTLLVTLRVLDTGKGQDWVKYVLSKEEVLAEVKKAHENGVMILCGTDPPNFQINYSTDLFEEMKLLSEAGLSNIDVLKTATVNVYAAFSLNNFGELNKGIPASFILINGNPVEKIDDIKNEKIIFKNGKRIIN